MIYWFQSQDFCDQMEQELKPLAERIWYGLVLKRIGDPTSFPIRTYKKAFGCFWTCFCRPDENVFEKLWTYVEQSSERLRATPQSTGVAFQRDNLCSKVQTNADMLYGNGENVEPSWTALLSSAEQTKKHLNQGVWHSKKRYSSQICHGWVENPDHNDVMMLHTVYMYVYIYNMI